MLAGREQPPLYGEAARCRSDRTQSGAAAGNSLLWRGGRPCRQCCIHDFLDELLGDPAARDEIAEVERPVHTAAASNLGQMLHRVRMKDGIRESDCHQGSP